MKEEENNNKSTGEIVTDNALKLQKAVLRQKIMIGALVGVIAVGGAGVAGYKLGWFGGGDDKAQEEQVSADIDPNAGDWDGTIPEAPKGDPNAESIELPGYPKIYIPAGQTDGYYNSYIKQGIGCWGICG